MVKTKEKKQEKIRLSDLSVGELLAKAKALRSDLMKKQLDKGVGRLRNTRELFNIRKNLARVKTVINIKLKLNSVKS
jgi:ribosomal protein L29